MARANGVQTLEADLNVDLPLPFPRQRDLTQAAGLRPARVGGIAGRSPQRNLLGALARLGNRLLTRFPSLANRLVTCLEKDGTH